MEAELESGRQHVDVCRVTIARGGAQTDIALPAQIPLGQLMPSLQAVLARSHEPSESAPGEAATCLHRPGQPPLDLSMTLSEHAIRDGELLVLAPLAATRAATGAVVPIVHAAEAVERVAAGHNQGWTGSRTRLAGLLAATVLAGVTGLLAVPGGIGTPSVLLGSASAAAAAAISAGLTRDGRTLLMALACLGTLIAVAALSATLPGLAGRATGLALAVTAVGVLTVAGRLSVVMSGLSAHITADLDPNRDRVDADLWNRAGRAQHLLTALVVGASIAAAAGAAAVAFGAGGRHSGWADFAVAGNIAALLLIRAGAHCEPVRRASLLAGAMGCTTALFVALARHDPALTPWICAAAAGLALTAGWLGCSPPAMAGRPNIRRWFDIVDTCVLVCVIPLAGWSSGIYGIVRGISL